MKRIAGYVVVTIILVFASLWVLAQVDLADLHQFLPGTKIEAGLMNENFELVQDAIEALQVQAGVASLNGQNGAIVLEAGDNIDVDDSEEGTIVISTTGSGSGGDHDHDERYYTQEEVDSLVDSLLPSGTVNSFFLTTCPSGWSDFEQSQGRLVVGMPSGGAVGDTVGTPLSDLEDREHNHRVDIDGSNGTETPRVGDHNHE